jgi:hypothetical protein
MYLEIYFISTKIVPYNIYDLLTARSLAFWQAASSGQMDDGSKQGQGLHISIYAFRVEDTDRLMYTLQDKFNLKCSLHYNRDGKPRIYIFKESIYDLRNIVWPYFISEMLYKLGE